MKNEQKEIVLHALCRASADPIGALRCGTNNALTAVHILGSCADIRDTDPYMYADVCKHILSGHIRMLDSAWHAAPEKFLKSLCFQAVKTT